MATLSLKGKGAADGAVVSGGRRGGRGEITLSGMNVIGHQACHRHTDLRLFLDYISEVEEGSGNEAGQFRAERRVCTHDLLAIRHLPGHLASHIFSVSYSADGTTFRIRRFFRRRDGRMGGGGKISGGRRQKESGQTLGAIPSD